MWTCANCGTKLAKAECLGIDLLDLDQFAEILGDLLYGS
ncbi:hypothetical protein B0I28_10721 [Glycomyces artemisiae]|uniref:Uncharacterized protein n=1 Tax=Glycomyces artemisiae TaxID=1076443 RepID=A0A2T0UGV8_9ACTN|nr:hypothetical protein B0I28_10721 [Glycomyces artemisiae]